MTYLKKFYLLQCTNVFISVRVFCDFLDYSMEHDLDPAEKVGFTCMSYSTDHISISPELDVSHHHRRTGLIAPGAGPVAVQSCKLRQRKVPRLL